MGQDGSRMPRRDDIEKALEREFAVLCFDWDGTAVADRQADADGRSAAAIERLCALGVDVAVVSGTNIKNVDGQLRARPSVEGRLFLFLSRGSEVYVVGPSGPRLLERRQATRGRGRAAHRRGRGAARRARRRTASTSRSSTTGSTGGRST